jgi:hypothetical protein
VGRRLWFGDGRFSNDAASRQRAAGRRGWIGRETLDQLDDLKALPGFELEKCSQQPEALDGIARWRGEFPVKLRKKSGTFHLAPSMGSIKVKAKKAVRQGLKKVSALTAAPLISAWHALQIDRPTG